ncbi:MAG: putative nucleotide-diphospho-sugar transferase [Candidatus Omnitrophica bacterium]|nr:putative nucleotide-diphospho-sugar transferase [Candidatus Omnitrophota bacterium]
MPLTRGVIYTAVGQKWIEQAILSAKSLKKHSPGIDIAVFTDAPHQIPREYFNRVIPHGRVERPEHWKTYDKLLTFTKTPYDHTLGLDADTYVLNDISEIFDILKHFDMAFCHAHKRKKMHAMDREKKKTSPDIPYAFASLQSGLLLYRKSDEVIQFFEDWIRTYTKFDLYRDQASLREVLWRTDLKFYVLPPEYNFNRIEDLKRWAKYGFTEVQPKIFHYTVHRTQNIEKLVRRYYYSQLGWRNLAWTLVRLRNLLRRLLKNVKNYFKK